MFVLWFNVSVNNFSVMAGRNHRFLGFNLYSGEFVSIAHENNTMPPVGIESTFLGSESDALPLCHHVPNLKNGNFTVQNVRQFHCKNVKQLHDIKW